MPIAYLLPLFTAANHSPDCPHIYLPPKSASHRWKLKQLWPCFVQAKSLFERHKAVFSLPYALALAAHARMAMTDRQRETT